VRGVLPLAAWIRLATSVAGLLDGASHQERARCASEAHV
jgi:hypothetical protein